MNQPQQQDSSELMTLDAAYTRDMRDANHIAGLLPTGYEPTVSHYSDGTYALTITRLDADDHIIYDSDVTRGDLQRIAIACQTFIDLCQAAISAGIDLKGDHDHAE